MSATRRLFYHRKLYDLPGTDTLFVRAMAENVRHHQTHCTEYADILRQRGYSPDSLRGVRDLADIPPLTTLFLKRHTLLSTDKKLMFTSTTSGTSGHKSVMGLDWPSAWNGLGMVLGTFLTHKLVSPRPVNYIILGYEPAKRNTIGAVKTAYAVTYAAPALHREYALRDTGEEYVLNLDGLREALVRYEKQRFPVRFMGFPAYFMFLLQFLKESGLRLKLSQRSLILLAGGWKQFFSERLEKEELYALSQEVLGLGGDRIREFFGAVEHPIAYFDCPRHHFHIPVYSRVIIRDAATLEQVPFGTPGLLNLLTPMMHSMPFCSVMTDDLVVLHPGSECSCGNLSPFFEVLGRVGLADIKTCAAGAAETLSVLGVKA